MLKRNSTELQVRLADDTAYGGFRAGTMTSEPTFAGGFLQTAHKINVFDNSSTADSKIFDGQVWGASKFSVDKSGNIIAAGTVKGSGVPTTAGTGKRAEAAFDDFDRADGAINGTKSASGHTWSVSGTPSAAVISGGKLTNTANVYCFIQHAAAPNRIDGTFSFSGGTETTQSDAVTLILDASGGAITTALHLTLHNKYWGLTKRIAGGGFVTLTTQPTNLETVHELKNDGTIYHVSMEVSGNNVTVVTPNGKRFVFTDTDVPTAAGSMAGWQITVPGGGSAPTARWHSISSGPSLAEGNFARVTRTDPALTHNLYGLIKTDRLTYLNAYSVGTGAGWYRVATELYEGPGSLIMGTARISIRDVAGRRQIAIVSFFVNSGGTPVLAQERCLGGWGGLVVSQVRLSRDANTAALDFNVATTNALDIVVELQGSMTKSTFSSSATALAGASTVLSLTAL
jgi:hypothetical protein